MITPKIVFITTKQYKKAILILYIVQINIVNSSIKNISENKIHKREQEKMHRKCANETSIWVIKMWKTSTYDLHCKPQAA